MIALQALGVLGTGAIALFLIGCAERTAHLTATQWAHLPPLKRASHIAAATIFATLAAAQIFALSAIAGFLP